MIFQPEDISKIERGWKTQTRRPEYPGETVEYKRGEPGVIFNVFHADGRLKWQIGRTYAIQPGKGKSVGRFLLLRIRREQLRDITWEDALAEGIHSSEGVWAVGRFLELWSRLGYRKPRRVEDNPVVFALTFHYVGKE